MIRILKWAVIAAVPFGLPIAVTVWAVRRLRTKNAVIVVREPAKKFVVVKGGRA